MGRSFVNQVRRDVRHHVEARGELFQAARNLLGALICSLRQRDDDAVDGAAAGAGDQVIEATVHFRCRLVDALFGAVIEEADEADAELLARLEPVLARLRSARSC